MDESSVIVVQTYTFWQARSWAAPQLMQLELLSNSRVRVDGGQMHGQWEQAYATRLVIAWNWKGEDARAWWHNYERVASTEAWQVESDPKRWSDHVLFPSGLPAEPVRPLPAVGSDLLEDQQSSSSLPQETKHLQQSQRAGGSGGEDRRSIGRAKPEVARPGNSTRSGIG